VTDENHTKALLEGLGCESNAPVTYQSSERDVVEG
jgi:hypothetical protein